MKNLCVVESFKSELVDRGELSELKYVVFERLILYYQLFVLRVVGLMEGVSHHAVAAAGVPVPGVGDALNNLEAEISELQRENARVECQMLRLRTDITAMEAHLRHDKVINLNLIPRPLLAVRDPKHGTTFRGTQSTCELGMPLTHQCCAGLTT